MFKPHSTLPPIVHPVEPSVYRQFGHAERGKPERTMCQSDLKEFGRCHHRWLAGFDEEQTACMADGALVDCVILTPERFEKTYAIAPESYTKKVMKCPKCGSETDSAACSKCKVPRVETPIEKPWDWNANACIEWRSKRNGEGLEVVKSSDASDAWKAREIFFQNDHISAFHKVSRTQVQVNVEWHDEETGICVPFKCLIDVLPDPGSEFGDTLADLKRTQSAEYRQWVKTVHSYGLAYQAALYLDAINAATGSKYRNFEHHIQESFAPFETTWRQLSVEFLKIGRDKYQYDLREYCRSLRDGNFHGYDHAATEPEAWMIA